MTHIYKMEEWESCGKWRCGDVSALSAGSNKWWIPANILGLSPSEYVLELKNKYNATGFRYSTKSDVLIFHFTSLADCRKFKNYVNRRAREQKFMNY